MKSLYNLKYILSCVTMKQETPICKLCLEPVYNFICVDCQHDSVVKFLEANRDLLGEFESFHKKLVQTFSTDQNTIKCIKCGKVSETAICPYCYAKEVFFWLLEKNPSVAENFSRTFNYDFMNVGLNDSIKTRNLMPIIICDQREKSDINICDSCGEPSDNLHEVDGKWLCEACRDD